MKKTNKSSTLKILIIILFIINIFITVNIKASEEKVIKVAFPEVTGFSMTDSEGKRSGLVIDYLNEISKYTSWTYQFIAITEENFNKEYILENCDLISNVYSSRAILDVAVDNDTFVIPKYDTGRSQAVLLARWEDTRFDAYDLTDINNKKIGVYTNDVNANSFLTNFLEYNDITCIVTEFESDVSLVEKLNSEEVDLILGDENDDTGDFRCITHFNSEPHYIGVVRKNGYNSILDQLNQALALIYESNPNFAEEIYEKNWPDAGNHSLVLNADEKNYVLAKKKIIVAVPGNFRPFLTITDDQKTGFLIELLNEVKEFSGLEYEILVTDTYSLAIKAVLEKRADVMGFYGESESRALSVGIATTKAYTSFTNVLVCNKSITYPSEGLTAAILSGTVLPDHITSSQVKTYLTYLSAITAVEEGEADFFYGLSPQVNSILQQQSFYNINVVPLSETRNVSFAVSRPADSELLTILNKTINNIPSTEINSMLESNMLYSQPNPVTIQDILYSNPLLFSFIILIVVISIILVTFIFAHSRIKTTKLKNELKQKEVIVAAKSDFLSQISHEIRTPMNGIVGMVELGRHYINDPNKTSNYYDKIQQATNQLLQFINNILDVSRLENHKLEINNQEFNFGKLLKSISSLYYNQAEDKMIEFKMVLSKSIDEYIYSDEMRINQIINNLLSNALKFTSEGGVVILQVDQTVVDNQTFLVFDVIDSGRGIAKENLNKIFEAFTQEDATITAKHGGTGLGLTIVKQLVDLLGGKIQVVSEINQGTKFTVRIPLEKTIQDEYLDFGKGKNVLVINQYDFLRPRLEKLFTSEGYLVDELDNVSNLKSYLSLHKYHLFIIQWDVTEEIKKLVDTIRKEQPEAKVIITGYDQDQVDVVSHKVKADLNFTLPIFHSDLVAVLDKPTSVEEEDNILKGKHVLIVENNELNQEIAKELLETAGAITEIAENGKIAIDKYQESPNHYYDLIIMDLQMPVMNGFDSTRLIRRLPRADAKEVIIIAMSANTFDSDIKKCYSSGMNAHIGKPFILNDIINKYKEILISRGNR